MKCQAIKAPPNKYSLEIVEQCSRRAKYKVYNSIYRTIIHVCGIHVKKYYSNEIEKIPYPLVEITLI